MGLNDGDSGGDGEEKPDSGYILKVESMSFADRLIVGMKHKKESRMTPRCLA